MPCINYCIVYTRVCYQASLTSKTSQCLQVGCETIPDTEIFQQERPFQGVILIYIIGVWLPQ